MGNGIYYLRDNIGKSWKWVGIVGGVLVYYSGEFRG